MPSRQTLTIGKEAMKKLRHFCVDTEVRPNDVVEAMILRENFDENGDSIVDYIKEMQGLTIKGGRILKDVLLIKCERNLSQILIEPRFIEKPDSSRFIPDCVPS